MAKENESNGNGKERIEISVPSTLSERLEALSEIKEQSVNSIIRDSVERYLDKSDVREVIRSACEKGKLNENSHACRYVDRD